MTVQPPPDYLTSNWQEITWGHIVNLVQGRTIVAAGRVHFDQDIKPQQVESITLEGGIELAATSEWSGPYSPDTPDLDAKPPRFWAKLSPA